MPRLLNSHESTPPISFDKELGIKALEKILNIVTDFQAGTLFPSPHGPLVSTSFDIAPYGEGDSEHTLKGYFRHDQDTGMCNLEIGNEEGKPGTPVDTLLDAIVENTPKYKQVLWSFQRLLKDAAPETQTKQLGVGIAFHERNVESVLKAISRARQALLPAVNFPETPEHTSTKPKYFSLDRLVPRGRA